jgi:hypothetical protein
VVRVFDAVEEERGVSARYAWARVPDDPGGRLLLSIEGAMIAKVVVTLDR